MSWYIGGNKNKFLKLKSILRRYDAILTTPQNFEEELTLTVVEKKDLPNIQKDRLKKTLA